MAKKQFNTIVEELKALKKQLSEDYLFGGDEGGEGMMDDDMGAEHQEVDPSMVQQTSQQMNQGDSEEEKALHAHEVIQHEPIIGKIRETAIEGIKKYADHPTSSLYEFFKKVFLDADRVLTDNGSGKK